MDMRVHGYVALNSIAVRYRTHSTLSDVSCMDAPLLPFSLGLVACGRIFISFFFFSSLFSFFPPIPKKPCQWEGEEIKLEGKKIMQTDWWTPVGAFFPEEGVVAGSPCSMHLGGGGTRKDG